jgi:probable addiction module antidote protein
MEIIKSSMFDSEEDIAAYLEACSEENDPALMAEALGVVARARNMSQLARDTGLTREGLYKALSVDGNPSLATAMKVANALGYQWKLVPLAH